MYLYSVLRISLSLVFHLWQLLIVSDHHSVCASVSAFHKRDCLEQDTLETSNQTPKQESNASHRWTVSLETDGFSTWFNLKSSSLL